MRVWNKWLVFLLINMAMVAWALIGCTAVSGPLANINESDGEDEATGEGYELAALSLPELKPAELDGDRLQVVATTSIIGDVVSHVGGEAILLTTLMKAGQDPHSFQTSTSDLTAAAQADVIFVNGWDLEEGLVADLENVSKGMPIVPISANIPPLAFGQGSGRPGDSEQEADPHTWLDPHLVRQWVKNAEQVLAGLDPANAERFASNAENYQEELDDLIATVDEQVAKIPPDRRKMVTNHDSLGYFAEAYDFEIVGTVIPGASTLAEPSASDLARLLKIMEAEGVCAIFAETTANEQLAEAVTGELAGCDSVKVITLFTGALGPPGGSADNYLDLMRSNVEAIAAGLN